MKISACTWEIQIPGKAPFDYPKIHRMGQITGPDKYAVRKGGLCLNKDHVWEYEPMPSNRDDEFMERCRFDTLQEAVDTFDMALDLKSIEEG